MTLLSTVFFLAVAIIRAALVDAVECPSCNATEWHRGPIYNGWGCKACTNIYLKCPSGCNETKGRCVFSQRSYPLCACPCPTPEPSHTYSCINSTCVIAEGVSGEFLNRKQCESGCRPHLCNASQHIPDTEWAGPSMAHGFIGDGTEASCEAWCCAAPGCATWSLLQDAACHLKPGQRCCMGWPAGRKLMPRTGVNSVSGRIDNKPVAKAWPKHPTWQPTWDMAASTIMMPCNTSGWFDPDLAGRYGIADFDWSTGREMWANHHPMNNARVLLDQAAMVKAANPATHVWVYRNLVKALSWYQDVGAKLSDPAYSGWFLRFDPNRSHYSSPPCTDGVCSSAYHSQDQTPQHRTGRKECKAECDCGQVPCGEYLWDHRNASLREWLVAEHVMGTLGMANGNVSGFYFDDYWMQSGEGWSLGPMGLPVKTAQDVNLSNCKTGPSEIQIDCLVDMGLSVDDVLALNEGWRLTTEAAMRAVVRAGGWVWQMFSGGTPIPHLSAGDGCVAALKTACTPTSTQQTRMCMSQLTLKRKPDNGPILGPGQLVDPTSDVARFLLTRGPFAFLGTGWVGCEPDDGVEGGGRNQTYVRPRAFDVDYGRPLGLCKEGTPGVFEREFSKATVRHDCGTGKSSISMKD